MERPGSEIERHTEVVRRCSGEKIFVVQDLHHGTQIHYGISMLTSHGSFRRVKTSLRRKATCVFAAARKSSSSSMLKIRARDEQIRVQNLSESPILEIAQSLQHSPL